jgi:hydrogenase/urease accessory protein HupE
VTRRRSLRRFAYVTIEPFFVGTTMKRAIAAIAAALFGVCAPAQAHPVPFSYIDVRLQSSGVELTVVTHVFDVAHDLAIEPPERLLNPETLASRADEIVALLRGRLQITADGKTLIASTWSAPEPLVDRQSLKLHARYTLGRPAGRVDVTTVMFPYDTRHKTFLNFYEQDAITAQAILDGGRPRFEYFAGTRQGAWAVVQKFVPSGVHHILIGPDHLLFLVGLLLLGGSLRQLLIVVTAFTIAHSITLSIAAMRIFMPPAGLIEPAIALSVVYVGADNLLVRGGRDLRGWIAFGFGFIHGFGFANVLRDMDLPSRALGWTLFSFNIGVEIGQLVVVIIVASALAFVRSRSVVAGRRLAFAGSIFVMAAGAFWFVQRVFFSGGMA